MDLKLGNNLYGSFKKSQSLLIEEFDKMAEAKTEIEEPRPPLALDLNPGLTLLLP